MERTRDTNNNIVKIIVTIAIGMTSTSTEIARVSLFLSLCRC